MPSEFYINLKKYCNLIDKSVDWFLRATEFKKNSIERQICYLKQQMYKRDATKFLKKLIKKIENKLDE